MRRRSIFFVASLASLVGCAAIKAVAGRIAATVETDLPTAATLYAIAKGTGEAVLLVLDIVNPPAAALINAAIAIADPIIATLPSIVTAAEASAAASTLLTQAAAIHLAAAPAYTIQPNAA